MKKTSLIALGLASVLGVAACSSDNKLSVTTSKSQTETTASDSGSGSSDTTDTSSSGDGGGGSASIPNLSGVPGLSEDCTAYLNAIASAFTGTKDGISGLSESFAKLKDAVPDDLKDDVQVLSDGFAELQKLYEKYNYDYTKIAADPEATKLFSDGKFNEASTNITAWLDKECPSG